jgi:hypothetical protein
MCQTAARVAPKPHLQHASAAAAACIAALELLLLLLNWLVLHLLL